MFNVKSLTATPLIAIVLTLTLSLGLNLFLGLSDFEEAYRTALTNKFGVQVKSLKTQIENSMSLGKPIHLFGDSMSQLFKDAQAQDPDISHLYVSTTTGAILYATRPGVVGREIPVPILRGPANPTPEELVAVGIHSVGTSYFISIPLYLNNKVFGGALFLEFSQSLVGDSIRRVLLDLGLTALIVFLATLFSFILIVAIMEQAGRPLGNRVLMVLVLAVLFASQIASTLVTGRYYAQAYTSVYDSNVAVLSQVVRKDLDKVLGYGVAIDHLKGCEEFLAQRLKGNPECSDMSVADSTGRILYHSGESGTAAATAGDLGKVVPDQMVLNLTPGSTPLAAGGLVWVRLAQGYLVLQINQKLITSHLTEQTMDSLTIAIVSLIMAFMLLELIRLRQSLELLAPSRRAEMMEEGKTGPRFIRLASFIFTFGAFVPLAFLPQHIQRIYQASPLQLFNWNSDIIVSVPIAMYMVGITVAMLLSMFVLKLLSLRHRYVIVSVLFIIGSILTVYARDILILSLARFVAGMGFGGALLATTSLVTAYTDERTRSTGFGISAAGFAAATLCSVPIGGVIVNRLGTGAGLYTAVIFGALFLAFILAFLRGEERGETVSPATVRRKLGFGQWLRILGSRHILTYTFFMNIPFQVLYWGLFQYVLPLYMSNSMGISEANIGRILSLFCIISLFAAFISRFADRLMNDKLFLATGGIVVGVALLLFNLIPGGGGIVVFIAVIAAMGVQNLVVDSIEEVYISKGKVPVEVDDETLLQSYKTMEKVLSVFVPTLSGLLILAAGFNVGMFIIGAYTLAGAVLFLVSAVNGRRKTVQEGVAK